MNNGNSLKALNIIHKAMLAGQILFAAVCFYIVFSKIQIIFMGEYMDKVLQVMAITFSAAGFFTGSFVFKKKLQQARDTPAGGKEKFSMYRSACILQWAFLEGPSLFGIICFFLTGNYGFIVLSAVLMLLFAMLAPSKIKIAFQLGLSEDELSGL